MIQAENGEEALTLALGSPPDMVISDILMPKMDGFTFCRKWKQSQTLKNIPFVIYTATYTDAKDREFALSIGAELFIEKPAEPDIFINEINEILDARQKGKISQRDATINDDESYLRLHNERLVQKLEEKISALEDEIEERKQVQEELELAIEEKQRLLEELHHRTNNNMQVILAMLKLQALEMKSGEIDYLVECTENRILAMSTVQQMIESSKDLNCIQIDTYIQKLTSALTSSYHIPEKQVQFTYNTEPISLLIDTALPLGLILNELISTAFEGIENPETVISIEIGISQKSENIVELNYIDTTSTHIDPVEWKQKNSIRLETICALSEQQMKAEMSFDFSGGILFSIRFPDNLYIKRV